MTNEQLTELKNNPVEFLDRGRLLRVKVDAKLKRIEQWQRIAESITAEVKQDGGFGGGYPVSKVESCVANIVDLQNEIKDDINKLISIEKSIEEAIAMLPNKNNMPLLLELRFLNYYTWEEAAEFIGITYRWARALYTRSLEFFREI